MKNQILIFFLLLLLASIFQVSLFPVPLGIIIILVWYLLKGSRDIVILAVFFSILLASLANIPSYLVLFSIILSLGFFVFAREVLPSKVGVTIVSLIFAALFWEASLIIFLKLGL